MTAMRKSRNTEEQIIGFKKQAEAGIINQLNAHSVSQPITNPSASARYVAILAVSLAPLR